MIINNPIIIVASSFILASLSTLLIVPLIKALGIRFDLIDKPDSRKQHSIPMVRVGGIAICIGFMISVVTVFSAGNLKNIDASQTLIYTSIVCSLIYFLIGLADDIFELSPWPRLALQIATAFAMWSQGIRIDIIDLNWISPIVNEIQVHYLLSLFITTVWIVGITNAINWMDGLDGLASGITGISAMGFLLLSFYFNQLSAGIIAAALAGSCIGFLRYNLNPASILMGDGGSYFLGISLASISILSTKSIVTGSSAQVTYLHLAILMLFLPLADMAWVIFTRVIEGHSPFYPDRRHLHHRLLRSGLSHKQSVFLLLSFSQWICAITLTVAKLTMGYLILVISSLILIYTFYINIKQGLKG